MSGVPAHWIRSELTWEDAIRPKTEPLSVTPPTAWGHSRPIQEAPMTREASAKPWGIWDATREQWLPDAARVAVDQGPGRYRSRQEAEREAGQWRQLNPEDVFEVRAHEDYDESWSFDDDSEESRRRRGVVEARRHGGASRMEAPRRGESPRYKPTKGVKLRIVDRILPGAGGDLVEFRDGFRVQVHGGSGRDDLLYSMNPIDMRYEGREPGPESRREYQYAALVAVLRDRPARFIVDRDGDVVATLSPQDRSVGVGVSRTEASRGTRVETRRRARSEIIPQGARDGFYAPEDAMEYAQSVAPKDSEIVVTKTPSKIYPPGYYKVEWHPKGVNELHMRASLRPLDQVVEDPEYIIQGLYSNGMGAGESYGFDDEATAIADAKAMSRSNLFEGDYVRVITRDGELVWDSRRKGGMREGQRATESPRGAERLYLAWLKEVNDALFVAHRELLTDYPEQSGALAAWYASGVGPIEAAETLHASGVTVRVSRRLTDQQTKIDDRMGRAPQRRFGQHRGPTVRESSGDQWMVRYVHKISPSDKDTMGPVTIPNGAFSDSKSLGAALRRAKVLGSGAQVRSFRVEGDKVVVFPSMPGMTTYWHSVVLTHY
jgi:hypothetical protein